MCEFAIRIHTPVSRIETNRIEWSTLTTISTTLWNTIDCSIERIAIDRVIWCVHCACTSGMHWHAIKWHFLYNKCVTVHSFHPFLCVRFFSPITNYQTIYINKATTSKLQLCNDYMVSIATISIQSHWIQMQRQRNCHSRCSDHKTANFHAFCFSNGIVTAEK